MTRALVLLALAALAACDGPKRPQSGKEAEANKAAPTEVTAATPCAEGWTVRLDEQSFVSGNFPSARLDEFLATAAASAGRAANEACAGGQLDPVAAMKVRTVTLASVADPGAPLFSADLAAASARVEWNFVAQDLTVPSDMEWRTGLACAIDAKSSLCPAAEEPK